MSQLDASSLHKVVTKRYFTFRGVARIFLEVRTIHQISSIFFTSLFFTKLEYRAITAMFPVYKQKDTRLFFLLANSAMTSSTLTSLSLWTRSIASEDKRSALIVLLSGALILFMPLKLRSATQVDTGYVNRIFTAMFILLCDPLRYNKIIRERFSIHPTHYLTITLSLLNLNWTPPSWKWK